MSRWREPRLPETTPGVQQANAEPNGCLAAGTGAAPTTPFRNDTTAPESLMKRATGTSEDCLFLKCVQKKPNGQGPIKIDLYLVSTFRASSTARQISLLCSGSMGTVDMSYIFPFSDLIISGGYVGGSASTFDGNDLLRESGNGVVVVIIQYRLGLFGFLPGAQVKAQGALNAGLR